MASAQVHHVKSARKDDEINGIKKGQEYWWWKFRYGSKQVSLTNPGVTRMIRLTEHEEKCNEFTEFDENTSKDDLEFLKEECENYRDELQDRLDNVPYSLQESHVLNERVQEVEEWLSSIEEAIDNKQNDEEE